MKPRDLTVSRQNKVSELENEIQQLKSSAGNRDSKNAILQQFLDDANAKLEEREKKHLQLYKENLSLIASLESVSQGDPIQRSITCDGVLGTLVNKHDSTDVFHKMRDQVKAEQTRHADLEVELSSIKSQLQNSENKCKLTEIYRESSERYANYFAVSLVGVNESSAIEALKTHQSAVLAETQSENRRLTRQFQDIEHDLEEHKVILRDTMKEKKALEESKSSNEDIKAALQEFTREAANRAENPNSTSNSAFEKQITIMADKITAGRERLAKRAEVQKTKSLWACYSDIGLSNISPSIAPSSTLKRLSIRIPLTGSSISKSKMP